MRGRIERMLPLISKGENEGQVDYKHTVQRILRLCEDHQLCKFGRNAYSLKSL
jgi:hypothetical protein